MSKVDLYHGDERPWMEQNKETRKFTRDIQRITGSKNFYFMLNRLERRYEFWEHRGPLTTLVFPLSINNQNFQYIGRWNLINCVNFIIRARQASREKEYLQRKEYTKHTNPSEYVDYRPKVDESQWTDTSPRVEGVQRVKVPINPTN